MSAARHFKIEGREIWLAHDAFRQHSLYAHTGIVRNKRVDFDQCP
jgi:hypothetical protein